MARAVISSIGCDRRSPRNGQRVVRGGIRQGHIHRGQPDDGARRRVRRTVVGNGVMRTTVFDADTIDCHTLILAVLGRAVGPALRQNHVVGHRADAVDMTCHVDGRLAEFLDHPGGRFDRRIEVGVGRSLVDVKSDIARHVESDVIADAGNANAVTRQIVAQLGSLAIHIDTHAGLGQPADIGVDEGALTTLVCAVVDEHTRDSIQGRRTDSGTLAAVGGLALTGMGVGGAGSDS